MSVAAQNNDSHDKPLKVRRGKVASVDLYEVKEEELAVLENGDPNSTLFNIAIALFSLAFSAILALCTASFVNPVFQNLFLFVSIIGVIGSIVLFVIWWKFRQPIKDVVQKIRNRIPPDLPGVPEDAINAPKLPSMED